MLQKNGVVCAKKLEAGSLIGEKSAVKTAFGWHIEIQSEMNVLEKVVVV
jgi:hypothetical protein